MHKSEALLELAGRLQHIATEGFHRYLLVLAGSRDWGRTRAEALLANLACDQPLWVGESVPADIPQLMNRQAAALLGAETGVLVYDSFSGFDADAFGALTGTLRGGGLLILLTPPLSEWSGFADPERARMAVAGCPSSRVTGRFLGRLARQIGNDPSVICIEEGEEMPSPPSVTPAFHPSKPADPECRTTDQAQAVEAVKHVVTGHRRRPVVLISDRGRGKSAALGIAAARLLKSGRRSILVTAPRQRSTSSLFEQASRLLPEAQTSKGSLHLGESRLSYSAPDHLLRHPQPADLLLVDEAAAIPTPMLEGLLDHYPRIAFATTIHGYEGTGRGFALRFRRVLDRRFPQWREIRLETPIRWAPDDPLERWLFRALALDAAPAPDELISAARSDQCSCETLERDGLAENEQDLTDLFGLLVLAHYRTTPFDLRQLLDGPNLTLFALRYRGRIVATALLAVEGGFDPATAHAIWAGYRRPRGHLLAQSLAAHLGLESGARLRGARIMRIAVHPALQRRGLGSRLVQEIRRHTQVAGLDYLGSSFGATPELLRFWRGNQLHPLRIGLRRGASSGAQSVIMLHPFTPAGEQLFHSARERFHRQLPRLLTDPLRTLDTGLACALLAQPPAGLSPPLTAEDWLDLIGFAFAQRGYETSLPPIEALVLRALADSHLAADQAELLVMKVLQNRDWQACAAGFSLTGRTEVEKALRELIGGLVMRYADPATRETALRVQAEGPG
ncbi:MAG: GNAT family N-acetyltransferase [Pseudomonadota bacterium]